MDNNVAPKVSVIVPVYNAEHVLSRTVESLQKQDYRSIEIILVNDGSKDDSLNVCNALAKTDSRILVIDKPNGGASSARNAGLYRATGEYVTFADSDDFVDPDYVSNLMKPVFDHGTMFVQAGYVEELNGSVKEVNCTEEDLCLHDMEQVLLILRGLVCSKIYSMEVIKKHGLCFPENITIAEDLCFVLSYVSYVDQWDFVNVSNYHYVMREDSASHTRHSIPSLFSQLKTEYDLITNLKEKFNLSGPGLNYRYQLLAENMGWFLSNLFLYGTFHEKKKYLSEFPREISDLGYNLSSAVRGAKIKKYLIVNRKWKLLGLVYKIFSKIAGK